MCAFGVFVLRTTVSFLLLRPVQSAFPLTFIKMEPQTASHCLSGYQRLKESQSEVQEMPLQPIPSDFALFPSSERSPSQQAADTQGLNTLAAFRVKVYKDCQDISNTGLVSLDDPEPQSD